MPRKRKAINSHTPLAKWIAETLASQNMSASELASKLSVSKSTLSAWQTGVFPAEENIPQLQKFANSVTQKSLAEVLMGVRDELSIGPEYERQEMFSGWLEVSIKRLIPRQK